MKNAINKVKEASINVYKSIRLLVVKALEKYKTFKRPYKIVIAIVATILVAIPTFSFSRYVYDMIYEHFFNTSNFYFKSDFLSDNNPEYTIPNWSGVDTYNITINMNSIKNEYVKADRDIAYTLSIDCGEDSECSLSKTSGVIYAGGAGNDTSNKDSFTVTVMPKRTFGNKEQTDFTVTAHSVSPYEKTISAKFILRVTKVGIAYEITDAQYDIFANLRITNSITYYKVIEAFDSYSVDDEIDSYTYATLSEENKRKCASNIVTVSFDPKVVALDMTNSSYLEAYAAGDYTTESYYTVKTAFGSYHEGDLLTQAQYNGLTVSNREKCSDKSDYVNSFTFKIRPVSSVDIRLYKRNKTRNYTFPNADNPSIVSVS